MTNAPRLLGSSAVFAAFSLLVAGCYPKSAPPPAAPTGPLAVAAQARFPTATEASLGQGHAIFIDHCNKCHSYPDVHAFSAVDLEKNVRRMAKDKAKLDDKQTELLVQFTLTANSTSQLAVDRRAASGHAKRPSRALATRYGVLHENDPGKVGGSRARR